MSTYISLSPSLSLSLSHSSSLFLSHSPFTFLSPSLPLSLCFSFHSLPSHSISTSLWNLGHNCSLCQHHYQDLPNEGDIEGERETGRKIFSVWLIVFNCINTLYLYLCPPYLYLCIGHNCYSLCEHYYQYLPNEGESETEREQEREKFSVLLTAFNCINKVCSCLCEPYLYLCTGHNCSL